MLGVSTAGIAALSLVVPATAAPVDYDRLDERLTRLAADAEIVGLAVAAILLMGVSVLPWLAFGFVIFQGAGYGVTSILRPVITADMLGFANFGVIAGFLAIPFMGAAALDKDKMPKMVYLDAQRWGSALPCHRSLDAKSSTRLVISGVPYDGKRMPLAPTRVEERIGRGDGGDCANFLADDDLGLIQAGDMVSIFTPGFEGAALSGIDAAEHVLNLLAKG